MGIFVAETRPESASTPLAGYYFWNRYGDVPRDVRDEWDKTLSTIIADTVQRHGLDVMREYGSPLPTTLDGHASRYLHGLDVIRFCVLTEGSPDIDPYDVMAARAELDRRQDEVAEEFKNLWTAPRKIGHLAIAPYDQPDPPGQLWVPEPADLSILPDPGRAV